jgi:hypothetical protein
MRWEVTQYEGFKHFSVAQLVFELKWAFTSLLLAFTSFLQSSESRTISLNSVSEELSSSASPSGARFIDWDSCLVPCCFCELSVLQAWLEHVWLCYIIDWWFSLISWKHLRQKSFGFDFPLLALSFLTFLLSFWHFFPIGPKWLNFCKLNISEKPYLILIWKSWTNLDCFQCRWQSLLKW